MSEGQSIRPRRYRNPESTASGFPIYNRDTLSDVKDDDRSEFGRRLVAARKHAGLTQKEVALKVGMSQGTLGEAEKEGQGSSYTSQIAALCGVSAEWLATGKGDMTPRPRGMETALAVRPEKQKDVSVVGRGNGGVMPQVIWTDGDYPVGYTGEYGEGIASSDPLAFLIEVQGLSMIPKYTPRNYALVEPSTEVEVEDDVLVRLKTGETMIKRLASRRDGYALSSYNDTVVHYFKEDEVDWIYYVAYPVPRKKIKNRA